MAQTVVPVYTIPNTTRVQQSLWESLCRIIPGIARTSESELHSFEPTTPRNVPVGQSDMAPGSGSSSDPGTGTVGLGNPQNVAVSSSTHKKDVSKGIRPASLPDGIQSSRALFQPYVPTVNLADDGDPPDANPPETSTPIKATPESGKRHTKKRLNISKIEATHLLFDMWDQQEKARRSVESEDQATVPDRTSGKGRNSGRELPHGLPVTLPDRPGNDGIPTDPTPEAPKWDNKRPHDDDDEIMEVLDEDKPAEPPKKKKKKKKYKDPKEAVPSREGEDDGTRPSTSMVKPEDVANEATPVPVPTEVPAEETKAPKKKK